MKQWIQTASGLPIDLVEPDLSKFMIEDVAASLSKQCRYTGHTRRFYSVAEHSYWASEVALQVAPELALDALLHDAHEAIIGDVVSPLKALLPDYQAIEARIQGAVADRFKVGYPLLSAVKKIDHDLMCTERQQLLVWPPQRDWADMTNKGYLFLELHGWHWKDAERCFLRQYDKLNELRQSRV